MTFIDDSDEGNNKIEFRAKKKPPGRFTFWGA